MPPPRPNIDEEKCFDKNGEKKEKGKGGKEGWPENFSGWSLREGFIMGAQGGSRGYFLLTQDIAVMAGKILYTLHEIRALSALFRQAART